MKEKELIQKIEGSIIGLENYLEHTQLKGWDPFDALNSPIVRLLTFNSKWMRVAFTQLFRRSPINFRPVFLTPKGHNPKGLGLFLSATLKRYQATQNQMYLDKCLHIAELLNAYKCAGYSGACWGYNFDWQNTRFLFKKGIPTIVNTSFICDALLDLYQVTKNEQWLHIARSACNFILNDINQTIAGDEICFSYTPVDHSQVHNANVLGARLLARVYQLTGEAVLKDTAARSIAFTVSRQNEDGSWYYGEWDIQKSIDTYHTGFVLESLADYAEYTKDRRFDQAIHNGLNFFNDHFFLADGTPKYYHNHTHPIDIHAIQALVTWVKLSAYQSCAAELKQSAEWFINHMQDKKGYFYYRKGRLFYFKTPYIRWGQAWAYHALTSYYAFLLKRTERSL